MMWFASFGPQTFVPHCEPMLLLTRRLVWNVRYY